MIKLIAERRDQRGERVDVGCVVVTSFNGSYSLNHFLTNHFKEVFIMEDKITLLELYITKDGCMQVRIINEVYDLFTPKDGQVFEDKIKELGGMIENKIVDSIKEVL